MQMEGTDWFYTPAVKKHFFKPQNFWPKDADPKGYDAYGKTGNVKCGDEMKMWLKIKNDRIKDVKWKTFGSLHPEEKILMEDYSFKAAKDIQKGEKIIDGEGKKNVVEKTLKKEYSGKMVTFALSTSKFYKITLTPNHPVMAVKRNAVALVKRYNRWSEVSQTKAASAEAQLYSASELNEGDFLLYEVAKETADHQELTTDMCTLLGYYVSDGNAPSKSRTVFYFGLEEEEFINEIAAICKKNNWKAISYKIDSKNELCIQINEPKVTMLLRKHGGTPHAKSFSQEAMLLPPEKQMRIIDTYINGDGWTLDQNENWKTQYFISTSSTKLASQLQMMLARNKIFAPMHQREARQFTVRNKKFWNSGEINLIFRKDTEYSRIKYNEKMNAFMIPITKIVTNDYSGQIFDLSLVFAPNTYRVNGITVHNCTSAIASTSMLSLMLKEKGGMPIKAALKIKPQDIVDRLGGLPAIKFHCSVLGDQALRIALYDYKVKNNREDLEIDKPREAELHH